MKYHDDSVRWNPFSKVVQSHRDGTIDKEGQISIQDAIASRDRRIAELEKALNWALRRLADRVEVGDHGAFVRGTNTELAGFQKPWDEANRLLSPTEKRHLTNDQP